MQFFKFYGVSSVPESVANIPDECHSDCRRGCAQEGSEFCDACVNLRNAYTLECIDTCPLGYTERNGYCYDSTLPTRVCNSPLKEKEGGIYGSMISLIFMTIINYYNYVGSCVDAGFTGCCIGENCTVFAPSLPFSCYCDALCYVYDDCCDDISSIGCYEDDSKFSIIWNKIFVYICL